MIRLRVLGSAELTDAHSAELTGVLAQPKRFALLVYLAISPGFQRRDTLLAIFWPELSTRRARGSLNQAIGFLRRELGGSPESVIASRGAGELGIDPGALWCDVVAFREHVQAKRFEEALELYRDELLPGFHAVDGIEFEQWLGAERAELNRAAARAASEVAQAGGRTRQLATAVASARRAVELSGLDEQALRDLLILLDRVGDRAGALHAYEDFALRLANELEAAPSAETHALVNQIRQREDVAEDSVVPVRLPPASEVDASGALHDADPNGTTTASTEIERPPSVADVRPAVPAELASNSASGRARWQRTVIRTGLSILSAAVVLAATVTGFQLYRPVHRPSGLNANTLVVAPFDVLAPDLSMWRDYLVDIFSRDFDGLGPLRTISASVALKSWSGRADPVSADSMARRTGAGLVLYGSLQRAGRDSVRLAVTMRDASLGKTLVETDLVDDVQHIERLVDSTTVALIRMFASRYAMGAHRVNAIGAKSIPALKEYLAGQHLYRHWEARSSVDSAAAHFARAIELDSTFALAYLGLAQANEWTSASTRRLYRAQQTAFRAAALNHGLGRRDSLTIVVDSLQASACMGAWRLPPQQRRAMLARMFSVLGVLTAEYPSDPDALLLYADDQYHCGSVLRPVSDSEVLAAFDRGIATDSAFTPAYRHLTPLTFSLGGPSLFRRYAEAMVRNTPETLLGPSVRTCAFLDSATRFPDRLASLAISAADSAPTEAAVCGVFLPDPVRAESFLWNRIQRLAAQKRIDQLDLQVARLEVTGTLAYRGRLAAVSRFGDVTRLPVFLSLATLGSIPVDSARAVFNRWKTMEGPHLDCRWILAWWSTHGDSASIADCIAQLKLSNQFAPHPGFVGGERLLTPLGRAFVALAKSDTIGAEKAFDLLPDGECPPDQCVWVKLTKARVLAARGRLREALAVLQWQAVPVPDRFEIGLSVPVFLERARIAQRLGDLKTATDSYRLVFDAWNGADAILQPAWREAKEALAHLQPTDASAK